MYIVLAETEFRATHGVELSDGSREQPHEHIWKAQAAVECRQLDNRQMGIDFLTFLPLLEEIVSSFEGQHLDDHKVFEATNATAEMVAKMIYDQLAPKMPAGRKLAWVEVTEAPGCKARYLPD